MLRKLLLFALALPAAAHIISISTGEARLEGNRLHYELRMPAYEVDAANLDARLLPLIEIRGATRQSGQCEPRPAENAILCITEWLYPAPVETVTVRSRLHEATVANHVHLVNAVRGNVVDQAVLELTSPQAEIRFEPQSAAEAAYQQFASGVRRATAGPPQWLFLMALVLAARSITEFWLLTLAYFAGQSAATLTGFLASPRFVELAAAAAVAYLAVEILLLPEARYRWIVVAVLGTLQGLALAALVQASHFSPFWLLLGAFFSAGFVLIALSITWRRIPWHPTRALAATLLAISLTWLAWRIAA